MLPRNLNHGAQKAREQRQSKVLKEKPQLLGTNPNPKQKLSVRSMARVGPFVKSR